MSTSTNHPRGRVLILALLTASACVFLADAAREHNGVTRIDPRLAHEVVAHREPFVTALAHALTFLGSEVVVALVMLAVMMLLGARRQLVQSAIVAVGMAGSAAMTVAIKLTIERSRPPTVDRLGPIDNSFSFPSGHTLNSSVALGLIVLTLVPALRSHVQRVVAVVAAVVLAAGIGASRIYLGYHWSTDVLASWLLATTWLVVLGLLLARVTSPGPTLRQSGHSQVSAPSVRS